MALTKLHELTPEQREKHLATVRRECIDFRKSTNREEVWTDLWKYFRNLTDKESPYKNRLVSTYFWSHIHSLVAALEPMFFNANPTFDLHTPRDEDGQQNTLLEKLLTQQIQYQSNFRNAVSLIIPEALVFGASYPWTFFKSERKLMPRWTPIIDPDTMMPILDDSGEVKLDKTYKKVRTYHAPYLQHNDLWNTFIHPDKKRGFTLTDVTIRELLDRSEGPYPMYDKKKVLHLAMSVQKDVDAQRGKIDVPKDTPRFSLGDDPLQERDFLAMEAGTLSGKRLEVFLEGYAKDAQSVPVPILHYDDSYCSGSYGLTKTGDLFELRFEVGASPDGEGSRLELIPLSSFGEPYGISMGELVLEYLKLHARFTQIAADGAELTVHPQWLVSQQFSTLIGELFTGPGAIVTAPTMPGENPNVHVQRLDLPNNWINAVNFREFIEKDINQLFSLDTFTQGQIASGRRTASEFNLANEYAANKIDLLGKRINSQFAAPLGRKWLCMNSLYMTPEDLVNVLGYQAAGLEIPDVERILNTMQVVFKGSVTSGNTQLMLGRFMQLSPIYFQALPLLQLPYVQEYLRRMFETAGIESVPKLFPPSDPNMVSALEQGLVMSGLTNGAGSGKGAPPMASSPTDIVSLMRSQGGIGTGGMQSPPPPMNMG